MNRRNFLHLSAATASGASVCLPRIFADDNPPASLRLTLRPDRVGNKIGPDFAGLSYESVQLRNPNFFSGENAGLTFGGSPVGEAAQSGSVTVEIPAATGALMTFEG